MAAHHVGCTLTYAVTQQATFALQIAPSASAGAVDGEQLEVRLDGVELEPPAREVPTEHGGRVHLFAAEPGRLEISYAATVTPADGGEQPALTELDAELLLYLRQSRYCPSDAVTTFAARELGERAYGPGAAAEVAGWVFERLAYQPGASGPLDTAVDTLLAGRGVCRDFAHLMIMLCRALGIPARMAAVYAPGLNPMDFHAVVEAHVEGRWLVFDPTRLAPRSSLVRIGTGRDAADTAFATVLSGNADPIWSSVLAVVAGELPVDDHVSPVALR